MQDSHGNHVRALAPAELAWVAAIPCALLTVAAIVVLGPPLGHALPASSSDPLWPPHWWEAIGKAEPVKHARYLLALLGPALLAAAVLVGGRRAPALAPRAIRAMVLAAQAGLLGLVAVALLGQSNVIHAERRLWRFFGNGTLALAAVLALAATVALRSHRVRQIVRAVLQERHVSTLACAAGATAYAATWLLEAVKTDRLVEGIGLFNWTLNDAFAVLDGRDPLVDYHPIYAKLLPYPAALALAAFGTTGFVYTLLMAALSLLALLAVYAVLRRLTGSSLAALGLFVPFVALGDTHHTMLMPAMWPMRYGGAYLLLWLTARHLDDAWPRAAWPLFLVAGVVVLNDLEFGLPALVASVVALLCGRPPRHVRDGLRLLGALAAGLLGASAAVSVLTLARAGSLPHLRLLLEWPRIFTDLGWFSLPMPAVGLYLALYATFAAALVVAAVRLAQGDEDRLLTSVLAWSGVFGLLAGAYYVGRSDDLKLASMLSAGALALVLLAVVCVRTLTARRWRAPAPAELLVLGSLALGVCQVGQLHPPQRLIAQLAAGAGEAGYRSAVEPFVAAHTYRGEKVAILLPESFRIAYDLGLDNVAPYELQNAIVTRGQMRTLLAAVERAHVREVITPRPGDRTMNEAEIAPEQVQMLLAAGFAAGDTAPGMLELHRRGG